jgi:hypothetical protein
MSVNVIWSNIWLLYNKWLHRINYTRESTCSLHQIRNTACFGLSWSSVKSQIYYDYAEHVVQNGSIFGQDSSSFLKKEPAWKKVANRAVSTLVSCSAYFPPLKMEPICWSETSVDFQWTTLHYIPEDNTLYNHRCETSHPTYLPSYFRNICYSN